jgi:Family of unknown function (DUF6492)
MTVARVVFLAQYRIPHACLSMQFDHNLKGVDRTVISSPVSKEELWSIFAKYNIDTTTFEYLPDSVVLNKYPEIDHWIFKDDYRGKWLWQQALKLAVRDYLDDKVILMHDPDTFMTEPYHCYKDGRLNYLILSNTIHDSYRGVLESVLGIERQTPHCFVTELVPVHRDDWQALKTLLEQKHNKYFLDAIIDAVPGMPTVPPWGTGNIIKWFSEYELLGNWAMYRQNVNTQEQRRFEYDSLDKLGDFTNDYNCFADAIPDLSLSLQWDNATQSVCNFDHYLNIIKGRL